MHKVILTFVVAVSIIGCTQKKQTSDSHDSSTSSIKVETKVVSRSKGISQLNYTGTIIPSSTTPLSFQMPGLVQHIYVSEGEKVKKGQILASINKESFQSAHDMAKANQVQAMDAYERLKKVYDQGSLPEIQWQEMNSNMAKANAAEALALQNISKCDIIAPIDGVIGKRDLEIGSTATPGISVLNIITIEEIFVRISVPETEISKIQLGQKANIIIPATGFKKRTATVQNIGVVANTFSKTYEVKLLMENPDQSIKPGMACDIELETELMNTEISIPYSAVIQDDHQKNYVFTVNKSNHQVTKQPIEIGMFSNNELIVTKGLSDGDLIVVSGHQKLHDNSTITF